MKHEIDLSNYQIHTDLAVDIPELKQETEKREGISISTVHLTKEEGKRIGKKEGYYITLEFEDITDFQNRELVTQCFQEQIEKIFQLIQIAETASVLIIGLGNEASTPDSLGPKVIKQILVTNHLFLLSTPEEGFRSVAAFAPGVMGQTGIETSDFIHSIVTALHPDFLIVIDALASTSLSRLNKTIQISDAGIHPGSGVGNQRKEISRETIGIPVIAIGIPTVVDAVTIVSDTFSYMEQHYAFHQQFQKRAMSKFIPSSSINYLKENQHLTKEEKKQLFGVLGSLGEEDTKELLFEVLTPIGYNLMVTPKEVDFLMNHLVDVLSHGLDRALHKKLQ